MKKYIIKFLVFCGISYIGAFIDAFLKDNGINITASIFFAVGYWTCYIINNL